jgi:hypothetical protein
MAILVCVNLWREGWPARAAAIWAERGTATALVCRGAEAVRASLEVPELEVIEWSGPRTTPGELRVLARRFERVVVDLTVHLSERLIEAADLLLIAWTVPGAAVEVSDEARSLLWRVRPASGPEVRSLAPDDAPLRDEARARGLRPLDSFFNERDLAGSLPGIVTEIDELLAPPAEAPLMLTVPEGVELLEEVRARIAEVERSLVELCDADVTQIRSLEGGRARVRATLEHLLVLANLDPEAADQPESGTFWVADSRRFLAAAEAAQRVAADVEKLLVEMEEREQNTAQTPSLPLLRERIEELLAELVAIRAL